MAARLQRDCEYTTRWSQGCSKVVTEYNTNILPKLPIIIEYLI